MNFGDEIEIRAFCCVKLGFVRSLFVGSGLVEMLIYFSYFSFFFYANEYKKKRILSKLKSKSNGDVIIDVAIFII